MRDTNCRIVAPDGAKLDVRRHHRILKDTLRRLVEAVQHELDVVVIAILRCL